MPYQSAEDVLPLIGQLENAKKDPNLVNTSTSNPDKQGTGLYQVTPQTARDYGFDPKRLKEPEYNQQAATAIVKDLWTKSKGDVSSVLVGYNHGAAGMQKWIDGGKNNATLPTETQNYLTRADKITGGLPKPLPLANTGAAETPPVTDVALREPVAKADAIAPLTGADRGLTQGQSDTPPVPRGLAKLRKFAEAGFTQSDIDGWRERKTAQFVEAGFSPKEIAGYFGEAEPSGAALDKFHLDNLAKASFETAKEAKQFPLTMLSQAWDVAKDGWNESVLGLATNGEITPNKLDPQRLALWQKIVKGTAQFAGDLPAIAAGAYLGFEGGAAVGGAGGALVGSVVPGVGTAVGGVVGAGVGGVVGAGYLGAATPQLIREALMDGYKRGEIHDFNDFMTMVGQSLDRVNTMGLAGAITAPLGAVGGRIAGAGAARVLAPVASKTVAGAASNVIGGVGASVSGGATFAGVAMALDGKVPTANDFIEGAALGLGGHAFHAGTRTLTDAGMRFKSNLETLYRERGVPPQEAVAAAMHDPKLRDELLGQDVRGKPVTPKFKQAGFEEPPKMQEPPAAHVPSDIETHLANKDLEPAQRVAAVSKAGEEEAKAREEAAAKSPTGGEDEAAGGVRVGQELAPVLKNLEGEDVTHVGIGEYQVPAGTARAYGFDPRDMLDPEKNREAAQTALNDLFRRYNGNAADALVAFHMGAEETNAWIKAGRDPSALPPDTQALLAHAGKMVQGGDIPSPNELTAIPKEGEEMFFTGRNGAQANFKVEQGENGKTAAVIREGRKVAGRDVQRITSSVSWTTDAEGNVQIGTTSLNSSLRGQGIARQLYERLVSRTLGNGKAFSSDVNVSADAEKLYKRLAADGYQVEKNTNTTTEGGVISSTDGKPVFTIRAKAGGGKGGEPPEPPAGKEYLPGEKGPEYTTDMIREKVLDLVSKDKPKPSDWSFKRLMRNWVSELDPFRRVDTALVKEGVLNRDQEMGIEDHFRQTYASGDRLSVVIGRKGKGGGLVMRGGAPGVDNDIPTIEQALSEVKKAGGDIRGLTAYMMSKRALDKFTRGIDAGVDATPDQLAKLIKEDGGKYEKATKMLQRTFNSVLRYGRDNGVFSNEQYQKMLEENPTYISFRRLRGDDNSAPLNSRRQPGRGFSVKAPVKGFEDGEGQIVNPLMASIDNMYQVISMADRNRAKLALVDRAMDSKELGAVIQQGPKIQIAEPGSDVFKDYIPQSVEPFKPFLAERAMKGNTDPNHFLVFRNGEAERWVAKDEDLAAAVRAPETPGQLDVVTRLLQGMSRLERLGVVATPDFPTRIMLRHSLTAYVLDPNHPPPFLTFMRGAMSAVKLDDRYWDWVAKGGAGTSMADMARTFVDQDLIGAFEKTGVWTKGWNYLQHPLEAAEGIHRLMNNAPRIGYTGDVTAKGIDAFKAATSSRKAFIDFVERGASSNAQFISRITPFFRPALLGLKQGGEAIANNPRKTLAYSLAAITMPQMALYALNYLQDEYQGLPEDQQYRNLPRYVKDSSFVFPQVAGVRLKLPVPFIVGAPFTMLPVRFLDHFVQDDPNAFHDWASGIASEMTPPMIPALARPFLEHATNHNFFTGKPLIPGSLEKASPAMQYTENTTETAKIMSRAATPLNLAMSPIIIENYARELTGTVGMDALKALDVPLRQTSTRPWEMSDIPVVQSFLIRNPGMNAQPIQDFYDMKEKFDQRKADFSLARKRLMQGGSQDEFDAALDNLGAQPRLETMAKAIKMQQSLLLTAWHDPDMKPEEKRQLADTYYSNMIVFARTGIDIMRSVKQ